ncbi:sensor histidine kinase [Nonomuraea sp. SYSU D8015]|uniref:sensor histidine kinase n=1 Tax=Nonomuraea sp. SYSU D8015 TaxID=2593644 RepID=UPI001660D579|nr:sensor histidine kinase [Nonomuraea sp. SYSU D8015]
MCRLTGARTAGLVAGGLAALSVVLVVAAAVSRFALPIEARVRPAVLTGDDVVGIAYPVLGALLVVRRPKVRVGWLMVGGGMAIAVLGPSQAVYEWLAYQGDLPAQYYPLIVNTALGGLGVLAVDLLLPLLYPDGRLPSRRWRPVAVVVSLVIAVQSIAYICRVVPPTSRRGPNPLEVAWLDPLNEWPAAIPFSYSYLLEAVCLLSLLVRFRAADTVSRRQIGWLLYAVAANLIVEFWAPYSPLAMLTTAAIPVAVAVAVMRYRLYGIDTLVSRTMVAVGVVGSVSAMYIGVGALLGLFLSEYGQLQGVAAALFAGAFFRPLRRRLQRLLDRLFYGPVGDPEALTRRLAREVHDADPATSLASVVAAVREGLAVTGAAIEVRDGQPHYVESGQIDAGTARVVPLVWHGENVGRLLIGAPGPRRFPAAHSERVINALTPYVADIAHAVRLTADLQRSRERILGTREEERRRLRRDLHDGLGQSLAGMAMTLTSARHTLRTSPEQADQMLRDLHAGMNRVTIEIRELVHGLRPPVLDDLGLEGAVRALAAEAMGAGGAGPVAGPDPDPTSGLVDGTAVAARGKALMVRAGNGAVLEGGDGRAPLITVSVSGNLSGLPAALEVAVYRILQEALTNAIRHANATTVSVTLHADSVLSLRVRDDGVGLAESGPGGVGMSSMRERAAEVGGSCMISSPPDGGALIEVSLPLGTAVPAP